MTVTIGLEAPTAVLVVVVEEYAVGGAGHSVDVNSVVVIGRADDTCDPVVYTAVVAVVDVDTDTENVDELAGVAHVSGQ